jgi:hypothetical protein
MLCFISEEEPRHANILNHKRVQMTTPLFSISRMGSICWSDCGLSLSTESLYSLIPGTYTYF